MKRRMTGRWIAAAILTADGDERTHRHFVPTEIFARHGLTLKQMNPSQQALARALLKQRVDVYAGYMADDIAADRLARIEQAGWDKVAFAWAGRLERGQKHYYRVQGPTFLIEYDNTQNDANHIHSVWRDFNGDFGEDLLREHVHDTPHRD